MSYAFVLTLTFLSHVNIIRCEGVPPNISLAGLNLTNILTSKVEVNFADDISVPEFYNDTDASDEDYGDFGALHPDKARELYEVAVKKNSMAETELKKTIGRQQGHVQLEEAYYYNKYFINKALELSVQSIYSTRYRLQETRSLRMKLFKYVEYQAAIKYGSLMQLRIKMDNVQTTMRRFNTGKVKFIWYVVLYEQCLAMSTDVEYLTKDMFDIDEQYQKLLNGEE